MAFFGFLSKIGVRIFPFLTFLTFGSTGWFVGLSAGLHKQY